MRKTMRLLSALALAAGLAGCEAPESYDLLINNGTVVDGTGAAPTAADVGISGDRIVAVGDLASAQAPTVIDATDLVVAPGFIDIHSHADRALVRPEYRSGEGLLRQGVTTAMFGIDGGYSAATIQELNDKLSDPGVPINFAFYVGHNGVAVLKDGKLTGATPGRRLRKNTIRK
jgi:N-acyl-D-aspartate/D-glutamate deacylase